jgi:hypothetical protein
MRSGLGAISAHDDHSFNVLLVQVTNGLSAPFRGLELWTAGAAEHRPASLHDATHVARTQRHKTVSQKSSEPVLHTENLPAFGESGSHHSPNSGVHPGSVTSARQHSNPFHTCSLKK